MENNNKIQYPEMPPVPDYSSAGKRRERNFPMWFINDPHRGQVMLWDNEYQEWCGKVEAWKRECQAIDAAALAARDAELAAGRPPSSDPPGSGDAAAGRPSPNHPARMVVPSDQRESRGAPSESVTDAPGQLTELTLASYRNSLGHTSATPPPPPDMVRHSRFCTVCSHPDRDAIEGEFVRWRSPAKIAEDFGIHDRRIIYRHAHATGLFDRRTREVSRILEQYMELVDHHLPDHPDKFDFDSVTRAVRVYAHLAPGLWFEPIRTHQILTGPIFPAVQPNSRGGETVPQIDIAPTCKKCARRAKSKKRNRRNIKNLRNSQNGTRHMPEAELTPTL